MTPNYSIKKDDEKISVCRIQDGGYQAPIITCATHDEAHQVLWALRQEASYIVVCACHGCPAAETKGDVLMDTDRIKAHMMHGYDGSHAPDELLALCKELAALVDEYVSVVDMVMQSGYTYPEARALLERARQMKDEP